MWKLVEDAKDVDQELLKLFPAKYFNLPQLGSLVIQAAREPKRQDVLGYN